MNRELKFRVWNPTYQEMLYPSSPTKNGDYEEKIYLQLDGQLMGDFKHTGLVNCSEHYVIQQFTGILDKNGKEIYEGDLIDFSINNTHELGDKDIMDYKNMDVHYSEEYAGFMFGEDGFTPLDRIIMTSIEIVGNIFNTLELIEQ